MTGAIDHAGARSPVPSQGGPPALRVTNLGKHFGGQRALDGVSFEIAKGEIVALLGENGSGKSTLVKILAGYHLPEPGGEVRLGGEAVSFPVASGSGLSFVFQDLGLAPGLSVVENLFVGHRAIRGRSVVTRIHWGQERRRAREAFERYGIDIAPDEMVRDLRPTDQALLAIARAAENLREYRERSPGGSGVLVLDEPTVFLPLAERVFLLELVRRVADEGTAVIFVSHDLTSVREVCRRALVLRDGRLVGDVVIAATSDDELVRLISGSADVGPTTEEQHHSEVAASGATGRGQVALEVGDLHGDRLEGVSFTLHGGEVLGVAGLLGSGSESLPYALFGALGGARGAIASRGWSGDASRLTPRRAIAAGFALVPADRQHQSAVGGLSVEKNLLSLVFDDFWSRGMLSHRRIRKAADERIRTFRVRPPNAALDMVSLSGGNQQKVVLARWLERHPSVLLLHEPTQGVDVTTRAEIYRIVENLTARGTAVVWVTTDFSELAAVSDRILIIGAGVVVRELHGPPISRDDISAAVYATKARVATDAS